MPHQERLRLLIVEDDPHIRYLLEAAATRTGLFGAITVAPDGGAALAALHEFPSSDLPGLIVTDLSMPKLTGIDLLRALKHDTRLAGIPTAVITSSDIPNDREMALAAGACAFVAKPYGLEALERVLTQLRESCAQVAGPRDETLVAGV